SGRWKFGLDFGGGTLQATAQLDEDWLLLAAPLRDLRKEESPAQRVEELLRLNAGLLGGAKFTLDAGRPVARLAAEIPLGEDIDLASRILLACVGFERAAARFYRVEAEDQASSNPEDAAGVRPTDTSCDLARLCREAGWAFTERAAGVAVTLDVPHGFYQALLRGGAEGVSAAVELTAHETIPSPCRQALGVFLLGASGAFRFARAAVGDGGGLAARLEVVLDGSPTATELAHALSALSVACRLCAREVRALEDEGVAREFLAVRGWSP